jgi:hypothetical protein
VEPAGRNDPDSEEAKTLSSPGIPKIPPKQKNQKHIQHIRKLPINYHPLATIKEDSSKGRSRTTGPPHLTTQFLGTSLKCLFRRFCALKYGGGYHPKEFSLTWMTLEHAEPKEETPTPAESTTA